MPQGSNRFFDYAAVASEVRDKLRDAAEVFESPPCSVVEAVAVGKKLAAAQAILGRGRFMSWCSTESSWSYFTINRLIRAAAVFGDLPSAQLVKFDKSAIYWLLNRFLPDSARQTAIAEAAAGRRVTYSRARQIAGAFVPRLGPRICGSIVVPEQRPESPLAALFSSKNFDALYLHVLRDENGEITVHGRAINSSTGEYVTSSRDDPDLTIRSMADMEERKQCSKCKVWRGLGEFTADPRQASGRGSWCRQCERNRAAKNSRLRRAKAKQQGRVAPQSQGDGPRTSR